MSRSALKEVARSRRDRRVALITRRPWTARARFRQYRPSTARRRRARRKLRVLRSRTNRRAPNPRLSRPLSEVRERRHSPARRLRSLVVLRRPPRSGRKLNKPDVPTCATRPATTGRDALTFVRTRSRRRHATATALKSTNERNLYQAISKSRRRSALFRSRPRCH